MSKSKKVVKKAPAPKPKKEKVSTTLPALEVKLVSYVVTATIPTMMYGNIQPRIEVQARTMEDAKRAVMPHIEELFDAYLEEPRDGKPARFMRKASVEATEKKVAPADITPGKATAPAPAPAPKPAPSPEPTKAPEKDLIGESDDEAPAPKSPAYLKAEGAVKNAMSKDALNMIEEQIQKSVKLTADEKPLLLTELLKKRKEFN
jgi:hypothetical protein